MGYTLGISSGLYGIKKDEDLLGLVRKIQWSVTKGVKFAQIDLETITEFLEPDLDKKLKAIKELGVEFGMHGESQAMGGRDTPLNLDSALETDYIRSHERLIKATENAGKIGSKYFLLHSSESTPFILLGKAMEPSKLVDFWGRRLEELIKRNKEFEKWILDNDFLWEFTRLSPKDIKENIMENIRKKAVNDAQLKGEKPNIPDEKQIEEQVRQKALEWFYDKIYEPDMTYGAERTAYFIVAKWMEMNRDPLWIKIANNGSITDEKFRKDYTKWVPAVAAKYIWGHFNPKQPEFANPKDILKKYKMYFIMETPTGYSGGEDIGRFTKPSQIAVLAENAGTDLFGVAVDFEHMLGNDIDPKKDIELFPKDGGKSVKVIHATHPTPLHTAHVPIGLGSDEQKYIYDRLWELREKGFTDGYIIFERGGGEDPVQETILALRTIKEFLEKNTEPKQLPLEFYGLKEKGPEVARQSVLIKQHALDPLKGMLLVPEEDYGILSTTAISKKGKGEEWKKEEYK